MKYIIPIFCITIFASCTNVKHPVNEITKVELARSGAWQDWGAAISIDSTLTYKYFGAIDKQSTNSKDRLYYTGKVSAQFWDTLNRKLESIKFRQIPLTDSSMVQDANYFELIVYWKNQKRRITRVWGLQPDSTLAVLKWLNVSYKNLELKQVMQPVEFETTFQNPPDLKALGIDIKKMRFPPPVEKNTSNKRKLNAK